MVGNHDKEFPQKVLILEQNETPTWTLKLPIKKGFHPINLGL